MPQGGRETELNPSLLARVSQAARFILQGVPPDAWMSPLQPLAPVEGQGARGRAWDFPVGFNLDTRPRGYEPATFGELRALGQSCDLVRLAIETRKDQIEAYRWTIRPRSLTAPAGDPRVAAIEDFLQYPDKQNDWNQWLRALLEEMFVIDAASLYRRRDRVGRLHSLQLIDGATLKPLIDESGLRPVPPDPAFEQILKGVPKNLYTSEELLYLPRNVRAWSVYGYAPVEQILLTVNIALRRSASQLQYYTDGNMPDSLVGLPKEWTADQMMSFQREWDAMLAGNQSKRRKGFFVPGEFKYQALRDPPLKDDFDEWLARIVCYAFSLPPTPFIKQMNRATAESSKTQALEEGLAPLLAWVKRLIDRVIREDFGAPDLEFAWGDDRAQDPAEAAEIDVNYVKSGIKSVDEVRAGLGLDPMGGAASRPMLATPVGYVPLEANAHAGATPEDDGDDPEDDGGGEPAPEHTPDPEIPPEDNNPFGSTPQIQRAATASAQKDYNPDQPRAADGRWTGDGDDDSDNASDSSGHDGTGIDAKHGTSGMDIDAATDYLRENAKDSPTGNCATYVREAIQAGGVDLEDWPVPAKDYGPYLESYNFEQIPAEGYVPQAGDVIVLQPYPTGDINGHIAMYDGQQWISDFVQRDMWGGPGYRSYDQEHQTYALYRP